MYYGIVVDMDECASGRREGGHNCPHDAKCVNTPGGFTCECPANYTFIDGSECKGTVILCVLCLYNSINCHKRKMLYS